MDYIIGVDVGTSGTKAVAFGEEGEVLGEHRITYPILNPQPHHYEQDPEVLFDAVIASIGGVVRATRQHIPGSQLIGVGFSSAMHGIFAVDNENRPLTHCIIWTDTRSMPFATQLKDTPEGASIYRATGTPIHPMSPLCKLAWMRSHMRAVHSSAHKFISIKEYVFYKLFSRYVVDESIASATGLFDVHRMRWHAEALELAGVPAERLSEPVAVTCPFIGVQSHFAAQMGIDPLTPFVIGGSDGCLANLGANVTRPGDVAVTIGTSGAIRMTSEAPRTDPRARTFSYVLTEKFHVLGGAVNNGGIALQWFRDNFVAADHHSKTSYETLIASASRIPAGSEGLIFLPYLSGERSPHWNANAKALFFGVQLHHHKDHFTRAVMEGVVFGLYSVGKALEEITTPIRTIHANGGFARSTLWLQLLADIFNREVVVPDNVEGSARGAYLVVLKALDRLADFSAIDVQGSAADRFEPDQARHQQYLMNFERFERLYDKVKDEF